LWDMARTSPRRLADILLILLCAIASATGCAPSHPSTVRTANADGPDPDAIADRDASADPLARYPQSPALIETRQTYADAAAGRGRDSVLMTTWFPGDDARVGEWSSVDPRGRVTIYRFVHDVGFQDSRSTSLVEGQLEEMQALLAGLPESSPPQTLSRALIVGCPGPGGAWVTRVYDRAAPPNAVRRIFHEMTGASLGNE
jgi:hypothetical protein